MTVVRLPARSSTNEISMWLPLLPTRSPFVSFPKTVWRRQLGLAFGSAEDEHISSNIINWHGGPMHRMQNGPDLLVWRKFLLVQDTIEAVNRSIVLESYTMINNLRSQHYTRRMSPTNLKERVLNMHWSYASKPVGSNGFELGSGNPRVVLQATINTQRRNRIASYYQKACA